MKAFYTDKEGVRYELVNPEPTAIRRFVKAVRGDTGKVVVIHDSEIKLVADPATELSSKEN